MTTTEQDCGVLSYAEALRAVERAAVRFYNALLVKEHVEKPGEQDSRAHRIARVLDAVLGELDGTDDGDLAWHALSQAVLAHLQVMLAERDLAHFRADHEDDAPAGEPGVADSRGPR